MNLRAGPPFTAAASHDAAERVRDVFADRRTMLMVGTGALAVFVATIVVAVGRGDFTLAGILLAIAVAPLLILLAIMRPYLFPYGLYVVLIPFDDLLGLGGGNGTLTKLIGIAAALALVIYAVRSRRIVRPPLAVAAALLYVLWMLITSLWAVDPNAAFKMVQTTFSLVVMFVVLSSAPLEETDLRTICSLIVLSGVLAAGYGIWFFHQHPPSSDGRLLLNLSQGHRIDANIFADSLLAPLALAVVALLHARRVQIVLAMIAAIALLGEAIVISLSREAMLGCVAIAFVIVMMSRKRLIALALLIPTLIVVPFVVPAIGERIATAASTGGAGRTSIWTVDLHAWAMHPVFGWGAGSAVEAYSQNLLRVGPRTFEGWDRPPHNVPLETLVDVGLIGLVLVVAMFVLVYRMLRTVRRGDGVYDLRIGLTAAFAAMIVVSFFIDDIDEKYLWLVLCTIAQLRIVAQPRPSPARVVDDLPVQAVPVTLRSAPR